jgi:hypothetical protein
MTAVGKQEDEPQKSFNSISTLGSSDSGRAAFWAVDLLSYPLVQMVNNVVNVAGIGTAQLVE